MCHLPSATAYSKPNFVQAGKLLQACKFFARGICMNLFPSDIPHNIARTVFPSCSELYEVDNRFLWAGSLADSEQGLKSSILILPSPPGQNSAYLKSAQQNQTPNSFKSKHAALQLQTA